MFMMFWTLLTTGVEQEPAAAKTKQQVNMDSFEIKSKHNSVEPPRNYLILLETSLMMTKITKVNQTIIAFNLI